MGETRRFCSAFLIYYSVFGQRPKISPGAPLRIWMGQNKRSLQMRTGAHAPLSPSSPPHLLWHSRAVLAGTPLRVSRRFLFCCAWVCGAAVHGCDFRNRQRVTLMSCRCWHVCSRSGYLCFAPWIICSGSPQRFDSHLGCLQVLLPLFSLSYNESRTLSLWTQQHLLDANTLMINS